jgi:hypothetical protein
MILIQMPTIVTWPDAVSGCLDLITNGPLPNDNQYFLYN